jgi:hypothetical protein
MDTDHRGVRVRLPTLALSILASLQLNAEERGPEVSRLLVIVAAKLDE